jgi:hypothetical protein
LQAYPQQVIRFCNLLQEKSGSISGDRGLFGLTSAVLTRVMENPTVAEDFMRFVRLGGKLPEPKAHLVDTGLITCAPHSSFTVEYNQNLGILDLKNLSLIPMDLRREDEEMSRWWKAYIELAPPFGEGKINEDLFAEMIGSRLAANAAVCDYLCDFQQVIPESFCGGMIIFPGTVFANDYGTRRQTRHLKCFLAGPDRSGTKEFSTFSTELFMADGFVMFSKLPIYVACLKR